MIVGISVATFTLIHVIITLIAIASGFIVIFGMIGSQRLGKMTALFLLMTLLTSVTGFMFFLSPTQSRELTPAAATGVVATIVFVICFYARYAKHLYGHWRWIYAVTAVISLYLNVFVLIVQAFEKIKLINPAAPMVGPPFTPPTDFQFAVMQGVTLIIFIMLALICAIKFRRGPGLME
ncbi:MAG TPA: hypothetical protein VFC54_06335 [Pseudolabrys sp.]|nr:hypothetical protein [Pseudolabrys sp.]